MVKVSKMDKLQIIILDHDIFYSQSLGSYIVNSNNHYLVKVLNTSDQMDRYLKECEESSKRVGEILLFDEHFEDKYINSCPVSIAMIKDKAHIIENKFPHKIYKYETADILLNQALFQYEKIMNKRMEALEKESKLIGFFSASGGTGKTTMALSVSRILSLYHKKVLYLSFEEIPSICVYIEENHHKKTISDFLYQFFMKEKESVVHVIKDYLITDRWGVETFVSNINYYNLLQLDHEDIKIFLNFLCRYTDYDYICLDISNPFQAQNNTALSLCHKLYYVLNQNEMALYKYKKYDDHIKASGEMNYLADAYMIMNRYRQTGYEADYVVHEYIEEYSNELLLEGSLGEDIKKIVKDIIFAQGREKYWMKKKE